MDNGLKLSTEQRQQLRLTPLQVRYVRMLEMSGPEFEEEVRKAVDEMPALEASSAEKAGADELPVTEDGSRFTESAGELQAADYRSEDEVPDYLASQMRRSSQASPEDYVEPVVAASGEGLNEYLLRQLGEQEVTDDERLIAEHIIGNLDDNGYMTRDLQAIADDIAYSEGKDFPVGKVREVWNMVRELDPAGIAAADLRDCLLLQLRRMPRTVENIAALEVVRDYFDLLAKRHFSRISAAMGIPDSLMRDVLAVVERLNPKPASQIEAASGGQAPTVSPDFLVETDSNGNFTLTLLNRVPELSIEATFAPDAPLPEASPRETAAARQFLRQKRDEAADFIRLVSMRQQTLFKVMQTILKFQKEFFLTEDEEVIQPMVLREVADAAGLDLSVVSRATQGKYVATPRGVYPLKMFFNERRSKEQPSEGVPDDNTTHRLIAALRQAIGSEDKKHPLSDEALTGLLRDQGIDIARRTVAKYREKLGFPVARLRRSL